MPRWVVEKLIIRTSLSMLATHSFYLIISIFLFQTLKFWISKFCKQHEGFHNLIGHQLQAIKIKLKGKGHQVVAVENLLKILKGLEKMTIICSKANLSQVSKIGLCESRKASLPFGLSSVEKEFYVEEHHRIDSGQIEFSQETTLF